MRGLTKRVNDTVAEVTNTPGDRLSRKEFERMVKSGEPRPLLVDGVPGLNLQVDRIATPEKVVPGEVACGHHCGPPGERDRQFRSVGCRRDRRRARLPGSSKAS